MHKKFMILILSFLFVLSSANAFSIGVSPSRIDISNKLPGETFEAVLNIQNPNDFDINIKYQTTGDLADWFVLDDIKTIESRSQEQITVIIRIPDDALNKRYNGYLIFVGSTDTVEREGGSAISTGIGIRFDVGVIGDNFARIEVKELNAYSTFSNFPVNVDMLIKNTGTISLNLNYDFEIWNYEKTQRFHREKIDGKEIFPDKEIFENIELRTQRLNPGEYTIITSFYFKNDLMNKLERTFTIYGEDEVFSEIELLELNFNEKVDLGEVVNINALFKNNWDKMISPHVKFFIHDINNNLIEVIETESREVNPDNTEIFETEFTFEKGGIYTISARGFYRDFYTNELQSDIEVTSYRVIHTRKEESIFLFYILIFSALAVVIYMIINNGKKRKKK